MVDESPKSPKGGENDSPKETQAEGENPKEPQVDGNGTNDGDGANDGDDQEECLPDYMVGSVLIGKWIPINKKNWNDIEVTGDDAILDCPSQVVPLMIKKPDLFPVKLPKIEVKSPKKKIRINEDGEEEEYDLEDGEEEIDEEEEEDNVDEETKRKEDEKKMADEAAREARRLTTMLTIPDYYKSSVGNMLLGVGLSRATEWFHKDAIKQVHKAIRKEGEQDEYVDELNKQTRLYNQCKQANACFTFSLQKCPNCEFKTESSVGLDLHMSIPHLSNKREYKCNYCTFSTRDPRTILFHFQTVHNRPCIIEPPPQLYECPFCQYESSQKQKAAAHVAKCQKFFNPDKVQYNNDPESELPAITPKPISKEDIIVYENTLATLRNIATNPSGPIPKLTGLPAGLITQMLNMVQQQIAQQARNRPKVPVQRPGQMVPGRPIAASPQQQQQQQMAQRQGMGRLGVGGIGLQKGQAMGANKVETGKGGTFVICEICDGYIKDLEQLRTHMQWIHKVKIHPKMLASRPPLNCQKCQWRFFTDQGLERHLLGAHGLVTSNMQDMVNANTDSGRCTVCGRVFASKLVTHMNQIHKVTLKPAHLSYKCTVCSATFNLYRLFESHVYMVHSGSVKRPAPTVSGGGESEGQSLIKREKIGEENTNANSNGAAEICSTSTTDRLEDQDKQPQPSVSSVGTQEISDEESDMNGTQDKKVDGMKVDEMEVDGEEKKVEEEEEAGEEELEKTCEVCSVTMSKEEYVSHVLKDHVTEFDVGLCQVERCVPCLSENDGVIIRNGPNGENRLGVDDGSSDSEESIEGDKLVEILNKDFEDPDSLLSLYANPGEKLHADIKYKKRLSDERGPFTLVRPMAPAFKEVPSWPQPEQARTSFQLPQGRTYSMQPQGRTYSQQPQARTSIQQPQARTSIQQPQARTLVQQTQVRTLVQQPQTRVLNLNNIAGLTDAQKALIPQLISKLTGRGMQQQQTYQKRSTVPEVINL